MKIIYHSDSVRVKVGKLNNWGSKYTTLSVQEKRRIWLCAYWITKKCLWIEVAYYWGYIPGDKFFGRCLKTDFRGGQELETWPPDIFELKDRIDQLLAEYFMEKKYELISASALNKQLNGI